MSKSVRYYAGKAPTWYKNEDSEEEKSEQEEEKAEEIIDSRLSRLSRDTQGFHSRRSIAEEEKINNQEESLQEKREKLKQALLQQEEEELSTQEEEEEEEEESEESESEEEIKPAVLFKPIFNKTKKVHIEKTIDNKEERKMTSREMVVEELKRDLINPDDEIEMDVDDTDGINPEEETQAWKLRELSRIKRDALEKETREKEEAEKEENRKKTDKELEAELAKNSTEEKAKIKFLQKYYHKGAFYADDEAVSKALKERDFTLPTLGDKVNKELLPSVMQVKNFGRSGQTKYTHLVDQDTTKGDAGWALKTNVNLKVMEKMGGVKRKFEGSVDKAKK